MMPEDKCSDGLLERHDGKDEGEATRTPAQRPLLRRRLGTRPDYWDIGILCAYLSLRVWPAS